MESLSPIYALAGGLLIGIAAAFTHPTTCVVFGVCLMAIFGWHLLTSRFSLGAEIPWSELVGAAVLAGVVVLVIGPLGVTAWVARWRARC